MAETNLSFSDYIFLAHGFKISKGTFYDYYGTLEDADVYFANRLRSEVWENICDEKQKIKALVTATRQIDRLKFTGTKYDASQSLEFPRNDDVNIPDDIKIACYELAITLLDDVDVEMEIKNLFINSHVFSNAKTIYDDRAFAEHTRNGIPSAIAWQYLRPYLMDPRNIVVLRNS